MAAKTREQAERELYDQQIKEGFTDKFKPTGRDDFYTSDRNRTLQDMAVKQLPVNSFNEPNVPTDGRAVIDYKYKPENKPVLPAPYHDFNAMNYGPNEPAKTNKNQAQSPNPVGYNKYATESEARPFTRLQQLAMKHGTGSKEFLRANYLNTFPEDETPNNLVKDNSGYIQVGEKETNLSPREQASLDVAMLMDKKQNSLQQRAASEQQGKPIVVEQIKNGNLLTTTFDENRGSGFRETTDMFGNKLSRADLEQMDLMARAGRVLDAAMPAQNASSQYKNEQAARTLQALSGLKAIPTVSDVQKDAATTRHLNVTSDLAPDLAQSTIGYQGANAKHQLASIPLLEAQARKALVESKYSGDETQAKINEMNAHADALRRGKLTKDDYPIERDAIRAATSQDMYGNPIFKPEIYDAVVSHARGTNRIGRPKTRAEAIDAYQKKWGKKYTVEQYNKMADRDGF